MMASTVAAEAFPIALSTMSTTMMPFLYHTRTLSGLRFLRSSAASVRATPKFRRHLHSNQRPDEPLRPFTTIKEDQGQPRDDNSEGGGGFKGVRFFPTHGPEKTASADRGHGSFVIGEMRSDDSDAKPAHLDGIPFDTSEMEAWGASPGYLKPKEIDDLIKVPSQPSKARETTITVAERHTFQRIFADIFARSQRAESVGTTIQKSSDIANPVAQRENARSKLNQVLLGATSTQSREEMERAVQQFPPALRAAAASSMGLHTSTPDTKGEKKVVQPDPLEHLREPERERVEALMRAAETDFELWQVMEQEVFCLVNKMGLQETEAVEESVPKKSTKKGKRTPKKKATIAKEQEDVESKKNLSSDATAEEIRTQKEKEEQRHQLAVLGPLYPSFLLLGMRLLDRSFAKPSPLTLTLLPKIKSLGLISHVLGASTALYNELLRIYWFQHDNFTGVLELLNEMEEAGLDHDAETLEIVNDITNVQTRIQRGQRGATLKTLWALPEYAPDEFAVWQEKIKSSVAAGGLWEVDNRN